MPVSFLGMRTGWDGGVYGLLWIQLPPVQIGWVDTAVGAPGVVYSHTPVNKPPTGQI